MDNPLLVIFQLLVLIFSVMIHEISHGAVALALGDRTAKNAGRLTLNPIRHIDPVGSILLPLFMFFVGGPIFGWAKPVPYNPFNLKNPKTGAGLIGAAGPLSNILVALIFGVFLRLLRLTPYFQDAVPLALFFHMIVVINVALAIFNLLPVPPLDGSSILFAFLPNKYFRVQSFLERYGFYILMAFIVFNGFGFIGPIIEKLYWVIVGGV